MKDVGELVLDGKSYLKKSIEVKTMYRVEFLIEAKGSVVVEVSVSEIKDQSMFDSELLSLDQTYQPKCLTL